MLPTSENGLAILTLPGVRNERNQPPNRMKINTTPAANFARVFIDKWASKIPNLEKESLEDAGLYIGILERLFVLAFIVTNHWEGVGFLLTAKSVFRFGDLTRAKALTSRAGVLASLWNHTTITAPAPGGGRAPWPTIRPQEMADLVALLQAIQRNP